MRAATATGDARSPARIGLEQLIALKGAGESIKLAAPRQHALGSGGHLSSFKGRGVEFDETRPYQPGDDLRSVDWRVTARTGRTHTKLFREERNRPILVWLDLRRPMLFATQGVFKAVRAAETAALVAWSAVAGADRFGGLVFGEGRHREFRPALGRRAALRLLAAISDTDFWGPAAAGRADADDARQALTRLVRVARPGSLVFLLSDFRNLDTDLERYARRFASHGELFLVHFFDPLEVELPPPGRYPIQLDGRSLAIETGGAEARERYRRQFEARRERLGELARLPSVRLLECATTDDPKAVLGRYFDRR